MSELIINKNINKKKCPYGLSCNHFDPKHMEEFEHLKELLLKRDQLKRSSPIKSKRILDEDIDATSGGDNDRKKIKLNSLNDNEIFKKNHGFFLTKSENNLNDNNNGDGGIDYVDDGIDLKDILNENNGKLIESFHFNFLFDLSWLLQQYPESSRKLNINLIYGIRGFDELKAQAKEIFGENHPFKFFPIKLKELFGTHHSKMIILNYETGIRLIIHTCNLLEHDWKYRTQGLWISPILKKLKPNEIDQCKTNFKFDLLQYIQQYDNSDLKSLLQLINEHNFSEINVYLIGSVPGRHKDSDRSAFGHLKLRKILKHEDFGPSINTIDWPIICQFSSIGSLGLNPTNWLTGQFTCSLTTVSQQQNSVKPELKLIYPSVENIRLSLQGYNSGSSFPYSIQVAKRQPYLNNYLNQWKSLNRNRLSPHIKTYCRISSTTKSSLSNNNQYKLSWFLLTSANLSKAAWGELQKNSSQLFIRSFELGVLFLPKLIINEEYFTINENFKLPYDLPLIPYRPEDKPWIWDLNYKKPDSLGQIWLPKE